VRLWKKLPQVSIRNTSLCRKPATKKHEGRWGRQKTQFKKQKSKRGTTEDAEKFSVVNGFDSSTENMPLFQACTVKFFYMRIFAPFIVKNCS